MRLPVKWYGLCLSRHPPDVFQCFFCFFGSELNATLHQVTPHPHRPPVQIAPSITTTEGIQRFVAIEMMMKKKKKKMVVVVVVVTMMMIMMIVTVMVVIILLVLVIFPVNALSRSRLLLVPPM